MKARPEICVGTIPHVARTCVIATCLLVLAGGLVGTAAGREERQATLRVLTLQPVKLAGSRFEARESVRVTVTSATGVVGRTVRATGRGAFVVSFEGVHVDRCNGGLTAVARGARGSFATARVPPLPLCPPGLREPE
jgi:hypothetical protein